MKARNPEKTKKIKLITKRRSNWNGKSIQNQDTYKGFTMGAGENTLCTYI
jgi:hypothetical protein